MYRSITSGTPPCLPVNEIARLTLPRRKTPRARKKRNPNQRIHTTTTNQTLRKEQGMAGAQLPRTIPNHSAFNLRIQNHLAIQPLLIVPFPHRSVGTRQWWASPILSTAIHKCRATSHHPIISAPNVTTRKLPRRRRRPNNERTVIVSPEINPHPQKHAQIPPDTIAFWFYSA